MNKIKKWHIFLFVILGIGGYWLFLNMWVFERQILREDVLENLTNSKWSERKYGDREWVFEESSFKIWTPTDSSHSVYFGEWKLNIRHIEFNGNALDNNRKVFFEQEIYFISSDTLILIPSLPSRGERHILKRIR